MFNFLSRWRPKHLAAAWMAYWVGLTAVKLGPALTTLWRLTRDGSTDQNSVSLLASGTDLSLTMSERGNVVYSGASSLTEIALWIVVPPLLLLVAWLFRRPTKAPAPLAAPGRAEIGAAPPDFITGHKAEHARAGEAQAGVQEHDDR